MSMDDRTPEQVEADIEKDKVASRPALLGSGEAMTGPVAPIKKMTMENQSHGNDRLHP